MSILYHSLIFFLYFYFSLWILCLFLSISASPTALFKLSFTASVS